jgi:hypothetical protein
MQAYTEVIHALVRGQLPQQDMSIVAEQRNWIQYRLMSLPSVKELSYDISPLYELCRLGAQIYSLAVIIPLPAATAPFARLVKLLKEAIGQIEFSVIEGKHSAESDLVLWILVLGGIASEGTQDRNWYLIFLQGIVTSRRITNCDDLEHILQQIVWLDLACNPGLHRLWQDMQNSLLCSHYT